MPFPCLHLLKFSFLWMILLRSRVHCFRSADKRSLQRLYPHGRASIRTRAAPPLMVDDDCNDGRLSSEEECDRKRQILSESSRLSLAPMMEYTDRHFRGLVHLISRRTLTYTEMVAANTLAYEQERVIEEAMEHIVSTDKDSAAASMDPAALRQAARKQSDDIYLRRYLQQSQLLEAGSPCVLQLGGSDVDLVGKAAETVLELTRRGLCNYTAINLNCGCPSPKVAGKGCFGAALMEDAKLVGQLTRALHEGSDGRFPITVKCRVGTDTSLFPNDRFTVDAYRDLQATSSREYDLLTQFIDTVASDGIVTDFSVHARIAVLGKSFSPADNRKIPPLRYDLVQRLVEDFPDYNFALNGGLQSVSDCVEQVEACPGLQGCMIGRAWASDPWSFGTADQVLYGDSLDELLPHRWAILEAYGKHADLEEQTSDATKIRRFICRAVTPLFAGEPRAKKYRIALEQIGGWAKQGLHMDVPISEHILNAAREHLSEETLFRSREESYERMLRGRRPTAVVADSE